MPMVVETVRGPLDVTELGPTLMHEHIIVMQPEALQNYGRACGDYWDEEARVADAVAKLRALREGGVRTIVDPTVPGLGRYIPRIQRINAQVRPQHRRRLGRLRVPRAAATSSPTAASTRSPSCSCARSARASTTPA